MLYLRPSHSTAPEEDVIRIHAHKLIALTDEVWVDPREVVAIAPGPTEGSSSLGLRGSDCVLEVPATPKAVIARVRDALTVDLG